MLTKVILFLWLDRVYPQTRTNSVQGEIVRVQPCRYSYETHSLPNICIDTAAVRSEWYCNRPNAECRV